MLLRIDFDPNQVSWMEIGRLWLDVDWFRGPWPTLTTVETNRRGRPRLGARYRLLASRHGTCKLSKELSDCE